MLLFSVPSDFRKDSLALYHQLNNSSSDHRIFEVYGQVTQGRFTASGRMIGTLPKVTMCELEEYIRQCAYYDIQFNYTMNPSCMEYTGDTIHELQLYIRQLYNAGVRHFTVTLPIIMEIIQDMHPDVTLKASAICEIESLKKAKYYINSGVSRIVVDPDITRNFKRLRSICSDYAESVEIIVNNMCMQDCPFKMFHYNHEAHGTGTAEQKENRYFYEKCSLRKASALDSYMKINWIRPEDLHHYAALGIRYFKLQGRSHPAGENICKAIKAYIARTYEGNLVDLLTLWNSYNIFQPYIDNKKLEGFLEPFLQNDEFCSGRCDSCHHCMQYAEKSIDLNEYAKTTVYAKQMFSFSHTKK